MSTFCLSSFLILERGPNGRSLGSYLLFANVTLKTETTHQDSATKRKAQSSLTLEQQHMPWAAYLLISIDIIGERSKYPSNLTHSGFGVSKLTDREG